MLTLNVILVVSLNMSTTMMLRCQPSSSDFVIFLFSFFFFSFLPTDPISGNIFNAKRKKKGGWPNLEKNLALTILLSNQMNLMTHFVSFPVNRLHMIT